MTVPFGALTDHYGFAAEGVELIASSKTPIAKSSAEAQDENGDVVAATWYGAPNTMFEASCTYALVGGLTTSAVKLGFVSAGVCLLTADVKTGNGEWPTLTVTGRLGCLTPETAKTYTLPAVVIAGKKSAQPIGFTVGVGCKLTGSGMTASIEFAEQADGVGVPCAHSCSGGKVSGSGDFVGVTAVPAWTVTGITGAVETQAPGNEEPQAAYSTGSGTWEAILAVDAGA